MGTYIKKSKIAGGDVSVKDISHPSTRTRAAKNLALQRLRPRSTSPSDEYDSFRYLQLRSRRLVKLPLISDTRKQQKQLINSVHECQTRNPKSKYVPENKSEAEKTVLVTEMECECGINEEKSDSACKLGEKDFDLESVKREMTPCSLRRESEAAIIHSTVPSSQEIEDFFAFAEKQQQRFFMDKYNFDIVSENPLPGRYEWVKVLQ